MEKILKTVFKKEHRTQWDKNVLAYDIKDLSLEFSKILYQLNKSPLNFANRDFVDKHIKFSSDGVFYCYYSACADCISIYPVPPKVERAKTLFAMQKMERRKSDGKIIYTMYMQADLNMKSTSKLVAMFLPAGMQEWLKKI
jgi:hypothetical protein